MDINEIEKLDLPEMQKEGLIILKKNCDRIYRHVVTKDYDWFHLVVGREGVGKSSFAILMAKLVDATFSVERVVFSYEDFKRAVVTAKPGQCIVVDEGGLLFFSRNAMKGKQKEIIQLLTIMRQRNLIVIICIPSINIVETYIREHRIRSLTRMKGRGYAWGYGEPKVKRIVGLMAIKKDKMINLVPPGFKIFVPDAKVVFPDFWDAYRKKKDVMIVGRHIQIDELIKDAENKEEVIGESTLYNKRTKDITDKYRISTNTLRKLGKKYPKIFKRDVFGRYMYSFEEFEKVYYQD